MSQAELANQIGISRAAISLIETGSTTQFAGRNLISAARTLGVSARWLATGEGAMSSKGETELTFIPANECSIVPLLQWRDIHRWIEFAEMTRETMTVPCPVECGERTFALVLDGESMAEVIPAGSYVYIDPDRTGADGAIVLAEIDSKYMIRQLVIESDGSLLLRARNRNWPEQYINLGDGKIVGVAIFYGRAL